MVPNPLQQVLDAVRRREQLHVEGLCVDPCRPGQVLIQDQSLLVRLQTGHPSPSLDLAPAHVAPCRCSQALTVAFARERRHHQLLGWAAAPTRSFPCSRPVRERRCRSRGSSRSARCPRPGSAVVLASIASVVVTPISISHPAVIPGISLPPGGMVPRSLSRPVARSPRCRGIGVLPPMPRIGAPRLGAPPCSGLSPAVIGRVVAGSISP